MDLRAMLLIMTTLSMTACGGGAAGSITPPGSTSGIYSLQGVPATVQAASLQLQQQGIAGRAWVSDIASYEGSPQYSSLYLQSTLRRASIFQYALDAEPVAMVDLLAQMNQRGAQSYAYKESYIFGAATYSVYVHDSAKSTTYSYEALTSAVNSTLSNFLAQVNAQGGRGFRWMGARSTSALPTAFSNLYVKESSGPASYTYSAISLGTNYAPANGAALLAALQQGAADGSRYLTTILAGSQYAMIFERPTGSSAAVRYTIASVPTGESLPTLLQTINGFGTQGDFFWGDVATMDGNFHHIFANGLVLPHPLYGVVYP